MSVMYDNLLNSADKQSYSCFLLLDLTKAFNTVHRHEHDTNLCFFKNFEQIKIACLCVNKLTESTMPKTQI